IRCFILARTRRARRRPWAWGTRRPGADQGRPAAPPMREQTHCRNTESMESYGKRPRQIVRDTCGTSPMRTSTEPRAMGRSTTHEILYLFSLHSLFYFSSILRALCALCGESLILSPRRILLFLGVGRGCGDGARGVGVLAGVGEPAGLEVVVAG